MLTFKEQPKINTVYGYSLGKYLHLTEKL